MRSFSFLALCSYLKFFLGDVKDELLTVYKKFTLGRVIHSIFSVLQQHLILALSLNVLIYFCNVRHS